jgi:hypothetical protein
MKWNKAYVTAHHPAAFASRHFNGRRTKGWHVYVPGVADVTGAVTWHFRASSSTVAWRLAAEAVEVKVRKRGSR